jgi:hypothetical protein
MLATTSKQWPKCLDRSPWRFTQGIVVISRSSNGTIRLVRRRFSTGGTGHMISGSLSKNAKM